MAAWRSPGKLCMLAFHPLSVVSLVSRPKRSVMIIKKRRGEKKQRRSTLLAVWREGDESSWGPFIIGPKVLAKGCPSLWVAVRLPRWDHLVCEVKFLLNLLGKKSFPR